MQTYDLLMLAVLAGATAFGAWKGMAWQVASLASLTLSYLVALQFRGALAVHIDAEPPWNVFLAMLALYVGTSLIIWIAFRLVARFIDRVKLKEFDRQVGAVFGLAKGVLLCVVITLFAVTLLSAPKRQAIVDSRSGHYISRLIDRAHAVMPGEVHDVIGPYLHRLDAQLDGAGEPEAPYAEELPQAAPPLEWPEPPATEWPSQAADEIRDAWSR